MTVASVIAEKLQHASFIRKMFEEGARLRAERGADRVFDFSIGNPEIEPPAALLDLVQRLATERAPHQHAYMPNAGFPQVRAAIAQRLARETGLPYTENHVLMTVGAGGALNTVFKAILDPGDEVIVLAPYFVEYGFYVGNHGGTLVVVDTDENFLPDPRAITRAITPRTKALLINSPNNPTGVLYSGAVYESIQAALRESGREILVISDEPYKTLVFDGIVAPSVPCHIDSAVVCTSWSKTLAIPGERIGYIAISPKIADARALFDACTFTNRILGFVNAPALWQLVVAEVGDLTIDIGPYQKKRDVMWKALTEIGYRCVKPEGAFYLFPATPVDDVLFTRALLDEGILAVPGSGFGRKDHMRLSMTVALDVVERSIPAFETAFRKFPTVNRRL